ncbi:MAG: ABC transporter ATP-binding protein [Atopobiaceae bacterium]
MPLTSDNVGEKGSGLMRPDIPSADAETIVDVDDVSMVFNIASEQFNSLKEYFIALARHELKFKEFRALDHISFQVKRGEAFGLVGTNGSGKSTMLKIIAGVLEASEGSCSVKGTIAPLIELGAGFDMELTAKENIYLNGSLLGYRREFIDEHFQDIIDFAELQEFMDMPLKNYSSGMVARIAFSIATITEPDILIVDETLSVGDFLFQEKCERRIKELVDSDNVTVLLVSHSIELVERMCDRVCWIEKGKERMLGPTDEVCEAYKNLGR